LEGQSCLLSCGAPPDSYCSCLVHDFFPYGEQPTVGPRDRLVHRTLSGAHRTVRCAQPIVGATTCHAKITRPTVALATGAPTDSPVNYSHVAPMLFPRAASPRGPAWRTGQSGVPGRTRIWLHTAKSFAIRFSSSQHCF
jgi:hypothetical protein